MSEAVVVLEDDPVVRRGLVRQIEASERFRVVAEAADIASARRALEMAPAVAIFDLELRDGSSLPLIPLAVERGIDVLVFTVWDDDERVYQALAAGAGGYLLKGDASAGRVADALHDILDGGAPISPTIARRLLDELRGRLTPPPPPAPPELATLTDREREIIELFAKGATYEEVGGLLTLSVNTIRHHVRSIYRKLHVSSKSEAVALTLSRA